MNGGLSEFGLDADTSGLVHEILARDTVDKYLSDTASKNTHGVGRKHLSVLAILAGLTGPGMYGREEDLRPPRMEAPGDTSADVLRQTSMRATIRRIFSIGTQEVFEDGMESEFSTYL